MGGIVVDLWEHGAKPAISVKVNTFLAGVSAVLDPNGSPMESGHPTAITDLYFCGIFDSPTVMLREIGSEARRFAGLIANQ